MSSQANNLLADGRTLRRQHRLNDNKAIDRSGRRQTRTIQAGSSYLSSEDPRVHFGFGKATVRSLTVRYPDGAVKRVATVATNEIVTVKRG